MGRKVNPIGFRLGIVTDWESKWYAERNYTEQLHEDLKIRRMIMRELTRAGISRIEIERSANKVDVTLHTSKPGIVIGKQGANVERLRQMLEKEIGKKVHLKIEEIKVPEIDARLIAREHRRADRPPRRVPSRDEARRPAGDAPRREGRQDHALRASWRCGDEPLGHRDGWPRAAVDAARRHRLRCRPRAHDLRSHRRQGVGLQGRGPADARTGHGGFADG